MPCIHKDFERRAVAAMLGVQASEGLRNGLLLALSGPAEL